MNATATGYDKASQNELVLQHLKAFGSIMPLEAQMKYGIMRLGARIWELKSEGLLIESSLVDVGNGKKVSQYRLINADASGQISLF